jgi:large subunit ribosomal protein L17
MEHGCIKTTLHRAKELRPIVEKLVTRAKNASVHDQRILAAYLFTGTAVKNLVNSHAKQNATRAGGYTRIVKHGVRFGDGAKIATLEFVESAV